MVTGSSWTTAGTLGVAFIGMAPILGVSTTIAAGAIISGAYVGDKMSPLSETTVLVPSLVGGVTTAEHIRGMLWTVVPSFGLALVAFLVLGLTADTADTAVDTAVARDALDAVFTISPVNLLPIVAPRRPVVQEGAAVPGDLRHGACSPASWPASPSPTSSSAFVDEPGQDGVLERHRGDLHGRWPTASSRRAATRRSTTLFSGGGMASMLTTVWLILGALSFAADHGARRAARPADRPARRQREVARPG